MIGKKSSDKHTMDYKDNEKFEVNVKNLGTVYGFFNHFDKALASLNELGIDEPISLRDLAYARIASGPDSDVCTKPTFVREAFVYVPHNDFGSGIYLGKSPILRSVDEAVRENMGIVKKKNKEGKIVEVREEGREFYPNPDDMYNVERGTTSLGYNGSKITIGSFLSGGDLPVSLFGEHAQEYGELLQRNNKTGFNIWALSKDYVDTHDNSFVRPASASPLEGKWDLNGSRFLVCKEWMMGVKKV